ncbi:hypothetical protein B0H21DRAFT_780299 [Amylocystis lapponica]|nr:hypothetical protein B0H21DRAFT_780299 [Amylocystis lapponica]
MDFWLFPGRATKSARKLVLSVIREQQAPLTVQEIFKAVVQKESSSEHPHPATSESSTEPPYPDHEIRSMRYLKGTVLPSLARTYDIQQVHALHTLTPEEVEQRLLTMTRSARKAQATALPSTVDVWRWKLRTQKPRVQEEVVTKLFGEEVGAGEDWQHLNKRRQRARKLKVGGDVRWLRKLEAARKEAADASEAAEGEVASVP